MKKADTTFFDSKTVTYLAVLAALIVVLQLLSGVLSFFGLTSITLALVPIVLGGIVLGVGGGAILGCVFGVMVLINAFVGFDAFTLYLLGVQPLFTVALCLVKGAAAGVLPALAYKLISKRSKRWGVITASLLAPVVNTGIFILGALVIFEPISDYLVGAGIEIAGMSPIVVILTVVVTVNFFIEFAVDALLSPAVYTVDRVVERQLSLKKMHRQDAKNDNLS